MQIRRFYSPVISAVGETLLLPESEARHALRVLRLRPGDLLLLLDGKGTLAEAELLDSDRSGRKAPCRILSRTFHQAPAPHFRLYVAPPHGKGFDLLLKAAVELGVARISPILCQHAVAKPESVSENWQNVLIAACKQAINPYLPQLDQPQEFRQSLKIAGETGFFGAVPDSNANTSLPSQLDSLAELALWIGPEGGFSPDEEAALLQAGCHPVTLGHCVLRVETAVPALLGLLHGLLKASKTQ